MIFFRNHRQEKDQGAADAVAPLPGGRTPGRGRIYTSITDTIGDTPIVRLDRLAAEKGV